MLKHITLGLALLFGVCAFAQAPETAKTDKPKAVYDKDAIYYMNGEALTADEVVTRVKATIAKNQADIEMLKEAMAAGQKTAADGTPLDKIKIRLEVQNQLCEDFLNSQANSFEGVNSIVQLVKMRRQVLQANDKAVAEPNDSHIRLHGSYIHITNGFMTTKDTEAFKAMSPEEQAEVIDHNYYEKDGKQLLKFPDLIGKQIDLPSVSGVIHSHQVGDWKLMVKRIKDLWTSTGLMGFTLAEQPAPAASPDPLPSVHKDTLLPFGISQLVMILICLLLIYLALVKEFEPLLLLPIGFGGLLANIPFAGITAAPLLDTMGNVVEPGGFLYYTFDFGVNSGLFPILIFMGVGAMTDFGPLIANPRTALLGAAAQLGIFTALLGALALTLCFDSINFFITDAASIGIIGGADGPTAIWLTTKLSPDLLGAIAVAAYSYMALVPVIQPPIMKLCTNQKERLIKMKQLRPVSKMEKVVFPITVLLLCAAFLPSAAPLIGAVMLGNLAKECGVVDRISDTMANSLINIVTILLGLSVGSKLAAEKFLTMETLGILVLGVIAFGVGTAGGVWMAKLMNLFSKEKINPLIGSAGVSAVPMAARVSNKVGLEYDNTNFLLMHAMGPNVSGVIGSAVVAGVLYFCCR